MLTAREINIELFLSSEWISSRVFGFAKLKYSKLSLVVLIICSMGDSKLLRSLLPFFHANIVDWNPLNIAVASFFAFSDKSLFLELSANPFLSRIIGQATISVLKPRSLFSCFITKNCWKSFLPKYAFWGKKTQRSFVTIVETPRKCPGRLTPSSGLERLRTSTKVWYSYG